MPPPFGPTYERKSPPFWPWPFGPSGPSPFVSPDLTVRHETATGHPLTTSGADVVRWGNTGSLGASHDAIPYSGAPAVAPPVVATEDGIRLVQFEGIRFLGQTPPLAGEFTAPVGPAFRMTPFWTCSAQRLREPTPAALLRWARAYGSPTLPQQRNLDIPIASNFTLVYQGPLGNMFASGVTDAQILLKWVVAEWGFNGTAFVYGLNGVAAPVAAVPFEGDQDPTVGFFGSLADAAHIDYRSWFSYRVWPTDAQRAQTVAYNMAMYPVTP